MERLGHLRICFPQRRAGVVAVDATGVGVEIAVVDDDGVLAGLGEAAGVPETFATMVEISSGFVEVLGSVLPDEGLMSSKTSSSTGDSSSSTIVIETLIPMMVGFLRSVEGSTAPEESSGGKIPNVNLQFSSETRAPRQSVVHSESTNFNIRCKLTISGGLWRSRS